jgi:cysteine dioxygenase
MRNLVRAGPWYYALVLCWKNGQRSPIHDHHGSSCAVRVLRGTLTETIFEFAPNGMVKAAFSRDFFPGSVFGSEDTDLHQVSNLQAGSADLVTLHVYSPPLMHMGTYSLVDASRGLEPMLMEFIDAAGI